MTLDDLDTPVLTVDLDGVDRNIRVVQSYMDTHGIAFRPHIKTHKIPAFAHRQVAAGAVGVTCQKLGEAEVMAAAHVLDILVTFNIVGRQKLERLMRLCRMARMAVVADSEYTVRGYAEATRSEGGDLRVLVEMDTGGRRAGVQSPEEAVRLARQIDAAPGLRFGGLMTYPTTAEAPAILAETVRQLEAVGLRAEVISGGGTACQFHAHERAPVNEHRSGTYIYNDRSTVAAGVATWNDCAARVIATVVSRPTPDRMILDGGSKTFTNDPTGEDGFGYFPDYPEAVMYSMSEEHGHVDISRCRRKPEIGERVVVIPNHACGITNLHDEVMVHRKGRVEAIWKVQARGLIR
ncbi:MAG: alanine racemase [Armatimonadetes bacterium]|nr:alanine racemase [Armatimonadota bacterium]